MKLKHANSILETFEYFCQKSSKSITTIPFQSWCIFWDTVYNLVPTFGRCRCPKNDNIEMHRNNMPFWCSATDLKQFYVLLLALHLYVKRLTFLHGTTLLATDNFHHWHKRNKCIIETACLGYRGRAKEQVMLNTDHSVGGLPTGGLSVANGPRSRVKDAFDPRLQNSDIMLLYVSPNITTKTTRQSITTTITNRHCPLHSDCRSPSAGGTPSNIIST